MGPRARAWAGETLCQECEGGETHVVCAIRNLTMGSTHSVEDYHVEGTSENPKFGTGKISMGKENHHNGS